MLSGKAEPGVSVQVNGLAEGEPSMGLADQEEPEGDPERHAGGHSPLPQPGTLDVSGSPACPVTGGEACRLDDVA